MHGTTNRLTFAARTFAVAAGLLALSAPDGAAQTAGGPRWQSWLGCWTGQVTDALVPTTAPLVCVTPTASADAVDIATVAGGKVVSTVRVDASGGGREQPIEAKGCTGTQRAQWSADERRVYLRSVTTCDGIRRVSSGILAITANGEWLDVQGLAAGEGENVRVARYHDAGISSGVPAEIVAALAGRTAAAQGARIAAGATIGTQAVIEASRAASPAVVEAWLLERGQEFALDAHTLLALADAGVPARVTDALVAVSNPKVFAVQHPEDKTRVTSLNDDTRRNQIHVYMEPLDWAWGSPYSYGYGYDYGRYGYGRYSPYGYGTYGYPGYFGTAPVIIVNGQASATHGRVVKGRGYTQVDQSSTSRSPSGRTAEPRSSSGSSSSTSGSSSSTPARAPDPAPTRTAHPKP